jgi:hypothetical protein
VSPCANRFTAERFMRQGKAPGLDLRSDCSGTTQCCVSLSESCYSADFTRKSDEKLCRKNCKKKLRIQLQIVLPCRKTIYNGRAAAALDLNGLRGQAIRRRPDANSEAIQTLGHALLRLSDPELCPQAGMADC